MGPHSLLKLSGKMATQTEYKVDSKRIVKSKPPEIFLIGTDELGSEAVALMNDRFKGNQIVELNPSLIWGSQPGYANLLRRYALGEAVREITGWNTRPINPRESELAMREGTYPGSPRAYYEILGAALYPKVGPNESLKKNLLNQARERGLEVELPAIATSLTVVPDARFKYGVRLDLGENGEIYHAPVLKKETGTFDSNDSGLVKNGVPNELGELERAFLGMRLDYQIGGGTRGLETGTRGLNSFSRSGYLNLHADGEDLDNANAYGLLNLVRFF